MSVVGDPKCVTEAPLHVDIERVTVTNPVYRRIIYTDCKMQVVLMSLKPGETVDPEVHKTATQFFRCEAGSGQIRLNGVAHAFYENIAIIVPQGTLHEVINTGATDLKFYTIYAAPQDPPGYVEVVKP